MSTPLTAPPAPAAGPTPPPAPLAPAPAGPGRAALRAEWTKLRTLPGTAWLLVTLVLASVGAGAAQAASVDTGQCPTPSTCGEDTTALALAGVVLGQAAAIVLAAMVVTSEYDSGTIGPTLLAVPRRGVVLAAKAAVVTAVVVPAATLAVALSLLAGRLILPANGFTAAAGYPPLSLADGPTLRAAAGTVAYLGLLALVGVGVGAAVRDTAGTIGTVLGLVYLFPFVAGLVSDPTWHDRIRTLGPMTAGLAVQATIDTGRHPVGPGTGLAIVAGWAAATTALGALVLHRRDA